MTQIIRIPCGIVNCYLVKQGSASFLVDTAYRRDSEHIERILAANNLLPGDLYMVLLTHGHADHAGGAAYFRQKYRLPLAMSSLEDDTRRAYRGKGLVNRSIWSLTRSYVKRRGPLEPELALRDGQSLEPFGLDAVVVALPGHTAGSVGFLFPDGELICGDTLSSLTRPGMSHIAEDTAALRQSVRRLSQLDISQIYPGHGKPFTYRELRSRK